MNTLKETLWPKLERLGEKEVRVMLAANSFSGSRQAYAEEWLRGKDRDREDTLNREQIDIARDAASSARDAADAARDAADEAREANRLASEANRLAKKANTTAKIAMAVAAIATIASIIAITSN